MKISLECRKIENFVFQSIPTSGLTTWYDLDKEGKKISQGTIHVKLYFKVENENTEDLDEHINLTKQLLLHELEISKCSPYSWAGKFCCEAEKVLGQHAIQSGLSPKNVAFARWSAFTEIHFQHSLAFSLFESLIDKFVKSGQFKERLHEFLEPLKRILQSCFSVIRKILKKDAEDEKSMKTLNEVLSLIAKIGTLELPAGTKLFEKFDNLSETVKDAFEGGAKDWFNSIADIKELINGSDLEKLENLTKYIAALQLSVDTAMVSYDKIFNE